MEVPKGVPNLKKVRESKNLTQEELANKIRVQKFQVSRWETGKSSISLYYRQKLCEELNTTLQELGLAQEEVKESREDTGSDERLLRHAADALKNPHLIQYLKWKYHNTPILERCGQVYPVAPFPAPSEQMEDLESVLVGRLDKTMHNDQDKNLGDSQFREMVSRLGRPLQNRITYTMKELLTEENKVGITCGLGTYFECLDTCDSLEWELLSKHHYLTRSDEKAFQQFETHLPLRSALHTKVADPVRSGLHRSVAIAISTLVAFNDEGVLRLWLKRRSTKVAVHASIFHVIPSFMFQPATEYFDEELSITHNIYREYLEELFNRPEPEAGDWRYFYDDPTLLFLQRLLNIGEAELYLSGVAVNLLNLRPEICTVLLIRSPEWHRFHRQATKKEDRFSFNEEWLHVVLNAGDSPNNLITPIVYLATDEEWMQVAPLQTHQIVGPGACAFWLGIDVLRKVKLLL